MLRSFPAALTQGLGREHQSDGGSSRPRGLRGSLYAFVKLQLALGCGEFDRTGREDSLGAAHAREASPRQGSRDDLVGDAGGG